MLFKLAFKNVKKSFRDYTIYFLTIAFGVCLFYVFNSLDSQSTMDILSTSAKDYYIMLVRMISGVSVFVSVILAFLIIYANKFLIKRRKKEISIYMLLGMDKSKISATLVAETLLTGLCALVVGLAIGIFASQGLSVVVANLFKANLTKFHFTFSSSAFVKTLGYFGIIFVLVMIFNVINISKCRLITLIQSGSKSETGKVRNFALSLILFVISIGCLIFAYIKILEHGFMGPEEKFWLAIIFGTMGTFLFFFSLSGIMTLILKKNKKLYYRHLNMFTFRQFTSKINTNCISISLICLMLLMTIGVLACANGVNTAMTSTLEKANPQDATYTQYKSYGISFDENDNMVFENDESDDSYLDFTQIKTDSEFNELVKESVSVSAYYVGIQLSDIASKMDSSIYNNTFYSTQAYKLSEFNELMKMRGLEPLTLGENQYAVLDDTSMRDELYDMGNMRDITINGKTLSYYGGQIIDCQIANAPSLDEQSAIIVNDDCVDDEYEISRHLLCNYNNENCEKGFISLCERNSTSISSYNTETESADAQTGVSVIATFISLYIGIIFLVTSCAVLALQQLSESTDNAYRYKLIRKLGASSKDINKALFQQIAAYFFMPLILAICHAVVGITAANKLITLVGQIDIVSVALITSAIIIVVYGGYFIATYLCSKSIIKK